MIAKWFIFEVNSSKIRVFGNFNHFIWFKLKNKFVGRFSHEKIYNPVHFYGDRSPMDREIKGEKSPQCTMKDLRGESPGGHLVLKSVTMRVLKNQEKG